jgi:hypothetical protein
VPPPPGSRGKGLLAGERGVGIVPIPTRGYTLWYSLYVRTYFVSPTLSRLIVDGCTLLSGLYMATNCPVLYQS